MQFFSSLFLRTLLTTAFITLPQVKGLEAQKRQKDILSRPAAVSNQPSPAFSAFQGALSVSGVPGGVAIVQGCPDHAQPVVHPHGSTLRELLDSITNADRRYVWRINRGVIDLEPSGGVPALLRIHFKTYDSSDSTDGASAVTLLASTPQVMRAASRLGLAHNVSGSALSGVAQGTPPPKRPLRIRLHDVTLLDVLNAIVRANKRGVWVYRETHCGSIHQFDLSVVQ